MEDDREWINHPLIRNCIRTSRHFEPFNIYISLSNSSQKKENLPFHASILLPSKTKLHNSKVPRFWSTNFNRKSSTNITILLSPLNIYIYTHIFHLVDYANKYREICKVKLERKIYIYIFLVFSLRKHFFERLGRNYRGGSSSRAKGYDP